MTTTTILRTFAGPTLTYAVTLPAGQTIVCASWSDAVSIANAFNGVIRRQNNGATVTS